MTNDIQYPYTLADKNPHDLKVSKEELLAFINEDIRNKNLPLWREECKLDSSQAKPNLDSFIQDINKKSTLDEATKNNLKQQNLSVLDAADITIDEACNSLPMQLRAEYQRGGRTERNSRLSIVSSSR